ALHILVRANVAGRYERARDALRELPHPALEPLALEGEGERRALVGEALRDRPRDRAPVRNAEHEAPLALEGSSHWASLDCPPCAAASPSSRSQRRSSSS